jgi:hypothetical protein
VYVVTGEPLAELKQRATARALAGDPGDERQYPMYPADLCADISTTIARRSRTGSFAVRMIFCSR